MPFAWASYILVIQVQYYAASWALNTITEWTVLTFAAPLHQAGLIFVAARLVLPGRCGDSHFGLRVYFAKNGKRAVAALAIRAAAALLANHFVLRPDRDIGRADNSGFARKISMPQLDKRFAPPGQLM